MRTKERMELELRYDKEHPGDWPPVPDAQLPPEYLKSLTCEVCWDAYCVAWWHRLIHRHWPDESERAKKRWMRERSQS